MLLIDVTIVNVALPAMAQSLHTSFTSLQWVIDAYALALAALLLGVGSIADLIGHRTSYLAGLVLFAVSSLVCGLSTSAGMLIAARTVQGIGAAAMFATTAALLNSCYQGRDRGAAYGWWGAIAGGAAAVGPIIGGLLVEAISWRWIFYVNIPVSVLAVFMTLNFIRADSARVKSHVDLSGVVTFTVSAAALTYALIRANGHGWATGTTIGLFAVSAVALAAFVLIEQRRKHPMLDLGLFRNRTFLAPFVAALVVNFAAFAGLTYSSIWLQTVMGLSPLQAGLTGLPLAGVAFITSATVQRRLHGRPGPVISVGMILIGLGSLLVTALVHQGSSWPATVPGFIVIGLGVGLGLPVLVSSAMAAVPAEHGGMAGGAINTARQLSYAIGIAVLGSVFTARAANSLHEVPDSSSVSHGLAGGQAPRLLAAAGPGRDSLDMALHRAAISGIDGTFLVAGIAGLVVGVLVWFLAAGDETSQPEGQTPAAVAAH